MPARRRILTRICEIHNAGPIAPAGVRALNSNKPYIVQGPQTTGYTVISPLAIPLNQQITAVARPCAQAETVAELKATFREFRG